MKPICPTCGKAVDPGLTFCPLDGTLLGTVELDPLLGVTLAGRYLLRQCIGSRGRFRRYASEEVGTGRAVVVTVLETLTIEDEDFARFRELAGKVQGLDHAACTPVHDFGRVGEGTVFLVEEGEVWHLLSQELRLKEHLPLRQAVDLTTQLLDGLDHLHGQGLVHAGLSPASLRLFFDSDGSLRLQIATSDIPCQALDPQGDADARLYLPKNGGPEPAVDIHAAALIMLQMVTGRAPGEVRQWDQVLARLELEPEVRTRLMRCAERGLALRQRRYTSAWEFKREIEALGGRSRFGRYNLLHRIGEGGMGEVFLARAEGIEGIDIDRLCVIKTILTNLATDSRFVDRFLAEARVLSSLSHGNIVPVYDVGKVGTAFYIAMQYVAGKDLAAIMHQTKKQGRRLPLPLALFIVRELTNGLAYAHRTNVRGTGGLVHRDVSPENILVSYDGDVRIIDFGIFQAASGLPEREQGLLVGKLRYMSPEQAATQPVDRRTDIYSAGLVLFELVSGTCLYTAATVAELVAQVVSPRVVSPSTRAEGIPPDVDRICLKALAPDREQRYGTAGEMRDDLSAVLARVAPRTNPEEVGAFVRSLFPAARAEEERLLSELKSLPPTSGSGSDQGLQTPSGLAGLPLLTGPGVQEAREATSLLGHSPTPIHVASTLGRQPMEILVTGPGSVQGPTARLSGTEGSALVTAERVSSDAERVTRPRRLWGVLAGALFLTGGALATALVLRTHSDTRVGPTMAVTTDPLEEGSGLVMPVPPAAATGQRLQMEIQATPATGAGPAASPSPAAGRAAERAQAREPDGQSSPHRPGPARAPRPAPEPPLKEQRHCLLWVREGPQGASLTVDGTLRGLLPLTQPLALEPGKEHTLLVRKGKLLPYRYRLSCKPGEKLGLRLKVR